MIDYLAHLLVVTLIYVTFAESLALLVGQLGLMSLTHAGLLGVAAFTAAAHSTQAGEFTLVTLLLAVLATACVAACLMLPVAHLSGDAFAITTFVFQLGLYGVFINAVDWTGGPMGIPGIPPIRVLGRSLDTPIAMVLPACLLAVATMGTRYAVSRSSIGRSLRLTRDDALFATSLGRDPRVARLQGLALATVFAAGGGVLFAHYFQFVSPGSFNEMQAIMILAMVIIGGAERTFGPASGAAFVTILPELLRFVGLPPSMIGPTRAALFGGALTLVAFLRADGIAGARKGR